MTNSNADAARDDWAQEAADSVAHFERINRDQRGQSWSPAVDDQALAAIPRWHSRQSWQLQLRSLLNCAVGQEICREVGISTEKVYAASVVMASAADHRDGRNVRLSTATIAQRAGFEPRGAGPMVRRVRVVLTRLQMGFEIVRGRHLYAAERLAARYHHGRHQTRMASVWVLSSPREHVRHLPASTGVRPNIPMRRRNSLRPARRPVGAQGREAGRAGRPSSYPQATALRPLPRPSGVCLSPSVGDSSPTRAVRARGSFHNPGQPRPLHLQRVAAELALHVPQLLQRGPRQDGDAGTARHVGEICDALVAAGIDTQVWPAREVLARLSLDGVVRGWSWPVRLANPAAFLTLRLRQLGLPATPPHSSTPVRQRGTVPTFAVGQPPAYVRDQPRALSTPQQRTAARQLFADLQAAKRAHRQDVG